MSLAKTILSRLFGSASDKDEIENPVSEVQEEEAPQPNPASLQLPLEHPLNKLWALWSEQAGQAPIPELCLEGPPEHREILSANELERELIQLRQLVTSTASERADEAVPEEEGLLIDDEVHEDADSDNEDTAPEVDGTKESVSEAENQSNKEEETQNKPLPDLDAQVVVFSTKNQMAAWLLVYPPVGQGKEVSRDMLVQALEDHEVEFGVDTAVLDNLPMENNRYFHLFFAAEGSPAVHGKDGYTIDRFPRKKQREMKVNEAGQVDYSELNIVNNADQGDIICQIVEPTEGVPGRNIFNKVLPAKDGKKVTVPKGRNTTLSEDGTALIATKPGHVEFDGRNFQVKPVMDIGKNVDYSTGNINFLGDIHIRGDVCSGFTVRAMGNITVDGVVEASTIEAGGDLVVVKGVKGNNQAVVKACGSIYAKYLESTVVCAKEELQTDCIINCNVYSDGQVQACSGRGIIIGGKIRAAGEVKANIIGSKSECLTSLVLGGRPSDDFEYETLLREIEELEEEFAEIEKQPDSPAKVRNLPMVRMKLSVNRTKLKQFETYIQEAKETPQNQEQIQDGRKLVCGIAYPGTEITIGDVTHRLEHETQHCRAMLLDGEIRFL